MSRNDTARKPPMCPADFPLGSFASRAAARAVLEWKHKARKRVNIVAPIPWPGMDDFRMQFGDWREWPDGTLARHVFIPHAWVKVPVYEVPCCLDCGALFKETKQLGDMMGFQASCLAVHDPDRAISASRLRGHDKGSEA